MLGLLMCSDVWVCLTDEERCIPFVLVEQGYDVWVRGVIVNRNTSTNASCFET